MPVHPQAQQILDRGKLLPPLETLDVAAARQRCLEAFCSQGPLEEVHTVYDRVLNLASQLDRHGIHGLSAAPPPADVRVRIYTPSRTPDLPVLVYFHGGGFVVNNLDTHDSVCRRLANRCGCIVASVDYARAPEHPFPAALLQCHAVAAWMAENARDIGGHPDMIALGGDSSGGTLAAGVSLMARDLGFPDICFQLLVYPALDHCSADTDSYREFRTGYSLTRPIMEWFFDRYLGGVKDMNAPYLFPLRTKTLENLPPAHIVTAAFDPLRDEGEAYAARLKAAGVSVTHKRYQGMIHGFVLMHDAIDTGKLALSEMAAVLKNRFQSLNPISKEAHHVY